MKRDAKARALLCVAGGRSIAATAREVGVDRKTVAAWTQDPVFAAEVKVLKVAVRVRPLDPQVLVAAVTESMARVAASPPPKPERPRRVPLNAGPEQRARITARYHARGQPGPWDIPRPDQPTTSST